MSFSKLHRNLQIRIITQFFTHFAQMMVLPFLTIYFAKEIGHAITGILLITIVLVAVSGGLIGGFVSDRVGRKRIMVWAELGSACSFLLLALLNSPWFVTIYGSYVVLLIAMFCGGVLAPVSQAMVYDVTSMEDRRYVFTFLYWVRNMSSAIAGVLGAFLFMEYRFYLFLTVFVLSSSSAIITNYFIRESYVRPEATTPIQDNKIWNTYLEVCKDVRFMLFLFAVTLLLSIEEQLTNFIAIYLMKTIEPQSFLVFQLDGVRLLGLLRSENTLLVVFATSLITWICRKWSDRVVLWVGVSFFASGYALFTLLEAPWMFFLVMLFITIGELLYVPVSKSMLGELAPDTKRSSYLAVHQFAIYVAMLIAGLDVILGGFVPSWVMGGKYLLLGGIGLVCFLRVSDSLQKETVEQPKKEKVYAK